MGRQGVAECNGERASSPLLQLGRSTIILEPTLAGDSTVLRTVLLIYRRRLAHRRPLFTDIVVPSPPQGRQLGWYFIYYRYHDWRSVSLGHDMDSTGKTGKANKKNKKKRERATEFLRVPFPRRSNQSDGQGFLHP